MKFISLQQEYKNNSHNPVGQDLNVFSQLIILDNFETRTQLSSVFMPRSHLPVRQSCTSHKRRFSWIEERLCYLVAVTGSTCQLWGLQGCNTLYVATMGVDFSAVLFFIGGDEWIIPPITKEPWRNRHQRWKPSSKCHEDPITAT